MSLKSGATTLHDSGPPIRQRLATRTITFVAFDGVALIDLFAPLETFIIANGVIGGRIPAYSTRLMSAEGGMVSGVGGLRFEAEALSDLAEREGDTLIVPGGGANFTGDTLSGLLAWLRTHGAQHRRLCSVCTGALILARAGLLDGHRATTHWAALDAFQRQHPLVLVERGPIFVKDDHIWTSAGVTAGMDLALALIEEDYGQSVAMAVARTLVVFMRRSGSLPQLSSTLKAQYAADPAFSNLMAWIADNLAENHSVGQLAGRIAMSPRTFTRQFRDATGESPARAVEGLRLQAACEALRTNEKSVKQIARDTGFGSAQNLRRVFAKRLGVSPLIYRHQHDAARAERT